MAKTLGTTVLCSQCGKKLRGVIGVLPGYHVRKHARPDGGQCLGYWKTDHKPAR